MTAGSTAFPLETSIRHCFSRTDLADAFSILLPAGASSDPERLAHVVFGAQAPWVGALMRVRDLVMARFGVKTSAELQADAGSSAGRRLGIFRIYRRSDTEIVLGEDDGHLDFRLSVLVRAQPSGAVRELVVSTVVHCHNRLGRAYLAVIKPFHKQVVRSSLNRAARAGWPA
ncbi:MAG TPA: DUF2867 domain-containing protein [Noviherbaspirillum sp.]|uniref:DUF2867 domain-containing protein n=1 Tax=Noviherbaspirillum sp. TaxID=1926288 RepID=UPI002D494803|nr:DUF2867 domain-containing protein [Noviherbaspirillum sp.]HYD95450.1 DUF2867 domain-containing protein [Noviherbaspirillum sp.]